MNSTREGSFENILTAAQFGSWDNLATIVNDVDDPLLESPSIGGLPMRRIPSQMLLNPSFRRSESNLVKKLEEMQSENWQCATSVSSSDPTPPTMNTIDTPPPDPVIMSHDDPQAGLVLEFGLSSNTVPPSWAYELSTTTQTQSPEYAVLNILQSIDDEVDGDGNQSTQCALVTVQKIASRALHLRPQSIPNLAYAFPSSSTSPSASTVISQFTSQPGQSFPSPYQTSPSQSAVSPALQSRQFSIQSSKMKKRKVRQFDADGVELIGGSCASDEEIETHSRPGDGLVLQCRGTNRKKRTRCRNAALMEYVGPRPLYCAEHISLDPEAMYHKCDFPLLLDSPKAQPKRCKEIVFKDFKFCYKHFSEWLRGDLADPTSVPVVRQLLSTASSLLTQLEREAARAKIEDPELYQRKSKLMPKYQSMVRCLQDHLVVLGVPTVQPLATMGPPDLTYPSPSVLQ